MEVDGHSHAATEEADAARTRWFEGEGYRVVRISNALALNREEDLAVVLAALIL